MRRNLYLALSLLTAGLYITARLLTHIEEEHLNYRDATCPCYTRP